MHCESVISENGKNKEKYSRGWRGAPAKGVGRVTGARVQIPLSPLVSNDVWKKLFQTFFLTKSDEKSFASTCTVLKKKYQKQS